MLDGAYCRALLEKIGLQIDILVDDNSCAAYGDLRCQVVQALRKLASKTHS
jgi:hypothetical protein